MDIDAPPGREVVRSSRFIGRETELARLLGRLDGSAGEGALAVVVRGEAGVGKSRLLRELAERAQASGVQVLWGTCLELGSGEVPYAPLIDALRRLDRRVGIDRIRELAGSGFRYLRVLMVGVADDDEVDDDQAGDGQGRNGQGRDPAERLRLFGAVLNLLDRLGRDGPVLWVIEDLHRADRSTLDLLSYLCRARTDERLLVVGSLRTGELSPLHPTRELLGELERARVLESMDLARFGREDLREYLRATMDVEITHDLVEQALELTVGNALFLEEVVAAGTLTRTDDGSLLLPATVQDLLLPRLEKLGDDARTVAEVAAAVGRRVSHRLLAAVCGLPEDRLLAALRECTAREVLVADPVDDTYGFSHPLMREVVHRRLIPGDRLRLHRAIALALAADADLGYVERLTVAAELSYHWFEARALPESLAAAVEAGHHAMQVLAFREASQQFDRALQIWSRVPNAPAVAGLPAFRLRSIAADAARWSGRIARAVELVRAAILDVDRTEQPTVAAELYERLGSYLWESGDGLAAEAAYTEAVNLLAGTPPSAVAARVRAVHATTQIRHGYLEPALELGREALEMARQLGARAAEGRALNSVGLALTMLNQDEEGVETLRAALRIAAEGGQLEDLYRAYANLVFALEHAGRLEEAVTVALEGLESIRQAGLEHTRGRVLVANNLGAVLVHLGEWDGAMSVLDQLRDHSEGARLFPRLTLAGIKVCRGEFAGAERLLAEIREAGSSVKQPQFVGAWYWCLAELAVWQGRTASARQAVLDGLAALADQDVVLEPLRLCALGLRAEADEAQRRPAGPGRRRAQTGSSAGDEIRAGVERLAVRTAATTRAEERALLDLCRVENTRVTREDSFNDWTAVAEQWQELRRPYPTAYALYRAAEAGVREAQAQRRPATDATVRQTQDRARDAARQAHLLSTRLKAAPLREAVERLATSARLDLTPAAPAAAKAPAGLTHRELEVLALVIKGKSNKEIGAELFISDQTAGVHVSRILRKLGVTRRGEIAGAVRELGLDS